ncbi:hypothetical protein LTR36_010681 [Oleoguttula mirabilis]|uniref:Cytochrome b5 heme-binding domain-containing protein n=1 Tax=Oleoguttula mirabilis TaxID=1507867 RepID=A0AAV9JRF1_9PEZI|nr:hypothetical protein LTR36_010681 [Oleoguttula mirabilis]
MPQTSFLALPTELRQEIYDHVFEHDERWVIYHIHGHVYDLTTQSYLHDKRAAPGSLGILRTCSQVYEEASKLLYASTKVTTCIRPPVAKAWSKSSISLGLVGEVRLWRFVRDLELTVELEPKLDVLAYSNRISDFIQPLNFGRELRRLKVVMQLPEEYALPSYTENILEALSQLKVDRGEVSVRFDGDTEDDESEDICGRLRERILMSRG